MNGEIGIRTSILLAAALGMSLLSTGCNRSGRDTDDHHSFVAHAAHAKCGSTPATVIVEIDGSAQVLKHPEDEVILVCPNDVVIWQVAADATGVGTFTVDFKNKNNPGMLFVSGHETFSAAGSPPQAGGTEKVKGNVSSGAHPHYDKDYLYSIQTFDTHNALLHNIDPHVIPVGN
jgi:hypothetical protein